MAEWTEQNERSNPFTLKLICWIALHLSRRFARLWLWPITIYFYLSSPSVRFTSRQYLRRVPGCHGSALEVICHIHCFSAIVLDRVYFLTDQFYRFQIDIHGEDCLDAAMAQKNGVILLGAHVGSFDAMRCLAIGRQHLPLKILMYRDHNAMISKVLDVLNPEMAKSVINLAEPAALLKMKEALEDGYFIGMLGDRVLENEKKITCRFLGEKINVPAGPFSVALMLGVPIMGFFGVYKGGNRYEVRHSLLYEGQKVARRQRADIMEKLAQEYVNSIETMVRLYPYNWFNFYDYWNDGE